MIVEKMSIPVEAQGLRWGKTTCQNTNGTTKIYSGRIVGQNNDHAGETSSNLCLHMHPKFGKKIPGILIN